MNIDMARQNGLFNLVLVAHIPYMYLDFEKKCLQERWLYQSVLETYLPFLASLKRLKNDNIPFKFNLVISPTLLELLLDKEVQEKCFSYIEEHYNFSLKEVERTKGTAEHEMAKHYNKSYKEALDLFLEYDKNILNPFVGYRNEGLISILTSPATFAYLPIYQSYSVAVKAQVKVAIDYFEKLLGFIPDGFWLPFCGYYPGLDIILKEFGVKYIYTATHAVFNGINRLKNGIYEPVEISNTSIFAFPRDRNIVDSIVNTETGYFNNKNYREYYHDVAFELPDEYIDTICFHNGTKSATGFKYYSRKQLSSIAEIYNVNNATMQTKADVIDFIDKLKINFDTAKTNMQKAPLITCPLDLEFLGGWWYEGISFIEEFFREYAKEDKIHLTTAGNYLKRFCEFEKVEATFSSCGESSGDADSYNQIWLDDSNSWVLRHIYRAIDKMIEMANRFPDATGIRKHMLNQAAKEVLMMMAEDWQLLLRSEDSAEFAKLQLSESLANFYKIYNDMQSNANKIDTNRLLHLEKDVRIFKNTINYKLFLDN